MLRIDADYPDNVFDAVETGLIVLDFRRCIRGWNKWMEATSGIAAEQARTKSIEQLFPAVAGTRLAAALTEALESGVSSVLTHSLHPALLPLTTRAGRAIIHNVAVQPLSRSPPSCLIQVTDVTAATARDQVLRERQNARYDAVVDSAPDAIVTLDAAGIIQLANPTAAREFGYFPRQLVGQSISVLFPDAEPWGSAWQTLLSGKPLTRPVELTARRKNGSPSFVEVSASRWRSDARFFVTAILRDVNERRAAEEALRGLNQTLEERVAERTADRDRMWRLSSDVMLVAGLDGTINSTNPAWGALLGWNEATLIGAPISEFVLPADREKLQSALHGMASNPAPRLIELGMRTEDGGLRQIAWNAVAADQVVQAVGRDVTAEREAEAALLKAEEALRQAQKMEALGQLTGGIAHDFNNLLAGIIGSMEMVKYRIAAGRHLETDRFIDAAVNSADRAAALTQRLLAFARRQALNPQSVDVNQLIRGMEDLFRHTLGEQVELEVALFEGVWPALTDANQLEIALLNLAINSRDAMPEGGRLTIETATATIGPDAVQRDADDIEPGDYTVICVRDTGFGMQQDTLSKVFDPFFTTKPLGQGTGLGLSMVYGFIKQSHGHIRLESERGKGTTVSLYLPRHSGKPSRKATTTARQPALRGSGETVLLVEDDPSVRLLIAEVLRELGYASLEAVDSEIALGILKSDARVDLMITDIGLPGISGRQLANIAREYRPNLKVIFVTGYIEHAADRVAPLPPGMEVLTKPFALDLLARQIQNMIEAET